MQANCLICVLGGALMTFGVGVRSAEGQDAGEAPLRGPGTVTVASGRSFLGEVHPRTDETRLWLRWSHGTIAILRPIQWQQVVQGRFAEKSFSGPELRRAAIGTTDPAPEASEPGVAPRRTIRVHAGWGSDSGLADPARLPSHPAEADAAGPGRNQTRRVRSLAVDARVANWDSDVEVDGLVVELLPLDAQGEGVPVNGTIEVTLIGWRTGRANSRQAPVRLGRWTRSVAPAQMGPFGFECRLPFQSVHPEFDLRWAPHGTVHVRLAVPGQGVFDATESTVRIRPYSAMRDHLEYVSGGRFFPVERTGRSRR